jgi:hypothetical protein
MSLSRSMLPLIALALCASLALASGCASRQPYPTSDDSDESIERPARPLSDEEGLTDRIGEVGIVILLVVVTVGLILIPFLLF